MAQCEDELPEAAGDRHARRLLPDRAEWLIPASRKCCTRIGRFLGARPLASRGLERVDEIKWSQQEKD